MRVILSAPALDLSSGGPAENIPNLAAGLFRLGVDVAVVGSRPGAVHPILEAGPVRYVVPGTRWPRWATYSRKCQAMISDFGADIIHDNGVWLPENHLVTRAVITANRKLVIAPRGMLEPWALQYRGAKKKLAWLLYQRRNLLSAHALMATAESERSNILKLLPGANVEVVPNGFSPPEPRSRHSSDRGDSVCRKVLFFSRIHPKKGVELLLSAWAKIGVGNWQLEIVGPGDSEYILRLKKMAAALGITKDVTFCPPVYGSDNKAKVIQGADIVILPSYSENFGSVVLEAMGLGVPVITTTETPWHEISEVGAGWCVEPSVEGILHALREAFSLDDQGRYAMGHRGHAHVLGRYTWDSVARQMVDVYERVLST